MLLPSPARIFSRIRGSALVRISTWLILLLTCASAAQAASSARHAAASDRAPAPSSGCVACHAGIEPIAPEGSQMMVQLHMVGKLRGDPAGCVVCHGGNPKATTPAEAHRGAPKVSKHCPCPTPEAFYPDPGALDVAEHTCGQCHRGYVARLQRALMATEAGKINTTLRAHEPMPTPPAGSLWGNRSVEDTDGPEPAVGTQAYKAYMRALIDAHPEALAKRLAALPHPKHPTSGKPGQALVAAYWQACDGCHLRTEGRGHSGEYRGRGCSACHMPYGTDGRYEGQDRTIDKHTPGHVLTHTLQGTRKTSVHLGSSEYSGIPLRACNTCHNRADSDRTAGVRPAETPRTPDDRHHVLAARNEGPLLCQDCHTSNEVHGDGNIPAEIRAQIEVRCADCHGTDTAYPWELPLGFGDPLRPKGGASAPRGLAQHLQKVTSWWATRYPKADGYLLTSRGNPFGNVVKDGERVLLHSASGHDLEVPLFKKRGGQSSHRQVQNRHGPAVSASAQSRSPLP